MLRYKCYICNRIAEERTNPFGRTISVPDEDGRIAEYNVCLKCDDKFYKKVQSAKRKIFDEKLREN